MADAKETCRSIIAGALNEFIKEKNPEAQAVVPEAVVIQNAPNPEMGDLGSPMFAYAYKGEVLRRCIYLQELLQSPGRSPKGKQRSES